MEGRNGATTTADRMIGSRRTASTAVNATSVVGRMRTATTAIPGRRTYACHPRSSAGAAKMDASTLWTLTITTVVTAARSVKERRTPVSKVYAHVPPARSGATMIADRLNTSRTTTNTAATVRLK
jgi:hypothetical protein